MNKRKKAIINPWIFNNEPFEEHCGRFEGFVYLMTHIPTGKKYIGKKSFWKRTKPKNKTRKVKVESDWKRYFSSSSDIKDFIKENGKDDWKREIIILCENAKWLNYYEVKLQFEYGVLESPEWLNSNINGLWYGHNYLSKPATERVLAESINKPL